MTKNNIDTSILFERTKINGMALKNRIVLAPMGTFTENPDGTVSDKDIAFLEERAKGGTALIMTETQMVTRMLDPWLFPKKAIGTDAVRNGWNELTERIHAYGAKVCMQIGCGVGRNGFAGEPGMKMVSASEVPTFYNPDEKTRALSVKEIHEVTRQFADHARRALDCGFDALEIHAHVGYLLDQFMSETWNLRKDEYGGTFENRMRFPAEVYHAIRDVVGPNFPILFRFALDHKFPGGRTAADGLEIVKYLDQLGVDAFDIDAGCYESHEWVFPPIYLGDACMLDLAEAVKKVTDKPVLNAGSHTPATAAKAILEGKLDYVMFGRGLIADPEIANKLKENRPEDICPCILCDEFCAGHLMQGMAMTCSLNARATSEKSTEMIKVNNPKKVVIVGGGPAGMEAARVSALRGHNVTLLEKDGLLGGQMIAAGAPKVKHRIKDYLNYMKTQMEKLNITVKLNRTITSDSEELQDADTIIVAVGATPFVPEINGVQNPSVHSVAENSLIENCGEKIVIAGGGLAGCDCALELALEGKDVTIIEMDDKIAARVNEDSRLALLLKLNENHVSIRTSERIILFDHHGVTTLDQNQNIHSISADTIITAFGVRSNIAVVDEICEKYPDAVVIGDCRRVGKIGTAVREGFFAAYAI